MNPPGISGLQNQTVRHVLVVVFKVSLSFGGGDTDCYVNAYQGQIYRKKEAE